MSLPARERGLKQKLKVAPLDLTLSLPPRERGLKLINIYIKMSLDLVAPPAGAWIETKSARWSLW